MLSRRISVHFRAALSILLLATASMAVHAQNRERQSGPSLAETEHWIENTFNGDNVGYLQMPSSDDWIHESYSAVFEGCTLGLESSKIHHYTANGIQHEQQSSVIYYVDLKDIDPASIKVYFYHAMLMRLAFVGLLTTNDEDKITTIKFPNGIEDLVRPSAFPHERHFAPELTSVGNSIPFDREGIAMAPKYAPRFIKAMRHATELCGGRRSTF